MKGILNKECEKFFKTLGNADKVQCLKNYEELFLVCNSHWPTKQRARCGIRVHRAYTEVICWMQMEWRRHLKFDWYSIECKSFAEPGETVATFEFVFRKTSGIQS